MARCVSPPCMHVSHMKSLHQQLQAHIYGAQRLPGAAGGGSSCSVHACTSAASMAVHQAWHSQATDAATKTPCLATFRQATHRLCCGLSLPASTCIMTLVLCAGLPVRLAQAAAVLCKECSPLSPWHWILHIHRQADKRFGCSASAQSGAGGLHVRVPECCLGRQDCHLCLVGARRPGVPMLRTYMHAWLARPVRPQPHHPDPNPTPRAVATAVGPCTRTLLCTAASPGRTVLARKVPARKVPCCSPCPIWYGAQLHHWQGLPGGSWVPGSHIRMCRMPLSGHPIFW